MDRSRHNFRSRSRVTAIVFGIALSCALTFLAGCSQESDDPTPAPETSKPTDKRGPAPIAGLAYEDIPLGQAALANTSAIVSGLGLDRLHKAGFKGQGVNVAILDNGFVGVNHAIGTRLPVATTLVKGATGNGMQNTVHGTKMAEVAYAIATGSPYYNPDVPGPSFILLNTNGFTNFKWAIDEAIRAKVDIILYAQVWEYGGNGDGAGFINREVKRATDKGILWVNAAGNFGEATYRGRVRLLPNLDVILPHDSKYVRFTVPQDNTPVKIVLAWNDFDDSAGYHTPQDLDLIVENDKGEEIGAGRLLQEPGSADAIQRGDPRYSAHAREIVRADLAAGVYRIRVRAKSVNFDQNSELRITVDGLGVKMKDGTVDRTILMPADNERVLTVGALDATYSASESRLGKPEIAVNSELRFRDGVTLKGTSAATAIVTGALATYFSREGRLSHQAIVSRIKDGALSYDSAGRPPPLYFSDF